MATDANCTSDEHLARPGADPRRAVVAAANGASSLTSLNHDEWSELCQDIEAWLKVESAAEVPESGRA